MVCLLCECGAACLQVALKDIRLLWVTTTRVQLLLLHRHSCKRLASQRFADAVMQFLYVPLLGVGTARPRCVLLVGCSTRDCVTSSRDRKSVV